MEPRQGAERLNHLRTQTRREVIIVNLDEAADVYSTHYHCIIQEMSTLSEARELLTKGRIEDAAVIYRRLLEKSPDLPEALHVLGVAAMRSGRWPDALSLLERATAASPADATLEFHLGRSKEMCGDLRGACGHYTSACRIDPTHRIARLYLGSTLERLGDREQADFHYARSIREAQLTGEWLDTKSTPESLTHLVEHASRSVKAAARHRYHALMKPLIDRYGKDSLSRVQKCIRILLNEESVTSVDSRQKPTFLFFPDLPATPFYSRDYFQWIDELEAITPQIQEELELISRSEFREEKVFGSDELELENLRGIGQSPSWTGHYFYRHGERREESCRACPITAAALERVSLCRVRSHAPEVLFSVFSPGTHLLPHRGVTNTRLVAHLPLVVPPDCALVVGGEVHQWNAGEIVIFDDTYEHEAWNRSDRTRVVLIMDVWNPHLTEVERLAVADLVATIGDFRHSLDTL